MDAAVSSRPKQSVGRKVQLLASLTSLRFFAALAIVLYHFLDNKNFGFLASGVTFFYILSGFVLTYVHPKVEGRRAFAQFWVARFSRIWPLHAITFLFVLSVQPFGANPYKHFWLESILNVSLLQCWVPVGRIAQSYNFVSWSLSVEAFFYFCFPFLLPWVFKAPWKTLSASLLLYFILAVLGLRLPDISIPNNPSYAAFISFFPPLHLYQFVLGMILAAKWKAWGEGPSYRKSSIWEIAVVLGFIALMPRLENWSLMLLGNYTGYFADRQLASFLYAPLFAVVIFVFAFQGGIVSRILSWRWLVYLGEISFSIYMVHCIVLEVVRKHAGVLDPVVRWTLICVGVLVVSAALYAAVEKPARRALAAKLAPQIARI